MGEGAGEGGIEGQRLSDGKGEMGRDSADAEGHGAGCHRRDGTRVIGVATAAATGRARGARGARCFLFLFPGLHRYLFFSYGFSPKQV